MKLGLPRAYSWILLFSSTMLSLDRELRALGTRSSSDTVAVSFCFFLLLAFSGMVGKGFAAKNSSMLRTESRTLWLELRPEEPVAEEELLVELLWEGGNGGRCIVSVIGRAMIVAGPGLVCCGWRI